MISANATAIKMTKVPNQYVEEGLVVEYVCETDYAYCTDPPVVLWFVGDDSVNASNVHPNDTDSSGGNYRQMTKSTMILTANRTRNNKQVKCVLSNDDTKLRKHNLNIKCKYIYTGITNITLENCSNFE